MASSETLKKLRAVRSLSRSSPVQTAEERLERIAAIAAGREDPNIFVNRNSPDLAKRLEAGMASRSKRNALDKRSKAVEPEKRVEAEEPDEAEEPEEKKRKKRGGRDRKEAGGLNRSTDVNL